MKVLLWVALVIVIIIVINELTWLGRSDLAWVIYSWACSSYGLTSCVSYKEKIGRLKMGCFAVLFVFPFITIPSIFYALSGYILLPIGFLLCLFTGKPSAIRASLIASKLIPVFLVLGIPLILYFYTWAPLGWIFFAWMMIYFISRRFTGAHTKEVQLRQGWKEAEAIEQKMKEKLKAEKQEVSNGK